MTLKRLDEAQLREIYRLRMRLDFPESELKPLDTMVRMLRAGVYDVLGAFDGEELAVYALVYRRAGGSALLLDYLAVEPSKRGKGMGSAALELIKERYRDEASALFIECERPEYAPDATGAQSRIRFYERAGAQMTDIFVTLFGVEFLILCMPLGEGSIPSDCGAELLAVYKDMLAPTLFERCVHMYGKA